GEGSWKITRSIGRKCKAGNRLSGPVLTAKRFAAWTPPHAFTTPPHPYPMGTQNLPSSPNRHLDIQETPGDHTRMVPPVPIPNTAVKQPGPMVVRRGRE